VNTPLPRLLLVTDADLSEGSRGAGRTVVNLFARYPGDALLAVSGSATAPFTMATGARVLAAAPGMPGRLAKVLQRTVGSVDAAWLRWRPLAGDATIAAFQPQLVLSVPTGPVGIALTEHCRAAVPLVTYLMDDWIAYAHGPSLTFNTKARGRQLLRDSQGWLSISPYLLDATRTFAGVERPSQIVHNPVVLGDSEPAALRAPRTGRMRIAYAGSVWPMHFDAVAAIAQGVQRQRARGVDIEFVLFTDRFFWGRHLEDWTRWGVVDGGLIPYDALSSALSDCDVLLVASSFDGSQAHMSRSSIQTKVTDYMAAGRPILACGPHEAASNRFLNEHECAFFAENPAPDAIDAALTACVNMRSAGPAVARRAWDVVRRDHERGAVTDRLYAFLREIAVGG
jgi:glycosyltransferase involved in cell wall biosynthesis